MHCRGSILALGLSFSSALLMMIGIAQAHDETKYPDLKGQWTRFIVQGVPGQPSFDQTKRWGKAQQAPLTPEYQAILEASIADQAKGGHGNAVDVARCVSNGMPSVMIAYQPLEFILTPETTYIIIADQDHLRRIFTDGRDWPKDMEPTYLGYAIGKWIDEDGDGRYDVLEVETRGPFKGPRVYDFAGLPLHYDNKSVFKERIYIDKTNPNILHDEITVIDNALTHPWTTDKKYVRTPNSQPDWPEVSCPENNAQIFIGKENYFPSSDGLLMPAKKDQAPPDLRYFQKSQGKAENRKDRSGVKRR
jgi:hypothetical protein